MQRYDIVRPTLAIIIVAIPLIMVCLLVDLLVIKPREISGIEYQELHDLSLNNERIEHLIKKALLGDQTISNSEYDDIKSFIASDKNKNGLVTKKDMLNSVKR